MNRSTRRRTGTVALWTLLLCPNLAGADLLALGHEFRPTLAERQAPDSCAGDDGTTARVRRACYRDGVEVGGRCEWELTAVAEWHDRDGHLLAGPYRISESARYSWFACSGDVVLALYTASPYERRFRTIRRDGVLSEPQFLCAELDCDDHGLSIVPMKDRFFVVWVEDWEGIRGTSISTNGTAEGDTVSIAPWDELPGFTQSAAWSDSEGRLLIAWSLHDYQHRTSRIHATRLEDLEIAAPAIQVSEFPYLEPWHLSITSQDPGQFIVSWQNPLQAGWVARRVTSENAWPTSSTTSTTLPSETPDFVATSVLAEPPTPEYGDAPLAPALAGDSSGTWLAAWRDEVGRTWQGHRVDGLVHSSSVDDARRWSASTPLEAPDVAGAQESRIATDQRGNWVVAWRHPESGSVLWRHSGDGGKSWSSRRDLYFPGGEEASPENMASRELGLSAGRDGVWVAAWINRLWRPVPDDGSGSGPTKEMYCLIRAATSTDSGRSWNTPRAIGESWCNEANRGLQVASDRRGTWKVVWMADRVYETQSTNNARSWSSPRVLVDHGAVHSAYDLDLAADGFGHWLLAFTAPVFDPSGDACPRVFLSQSNNGSSVWTEPVGIAPWHGQDGGLDDTPSLAAAGNGLWGVAWRTHTDMGGNGLDGDIAVSFSEDNARTWSRPRPIDAEATVDSREDGTPRLVHAGANAWGVLWRTWEPIPGSYDWQGSIRFARTRGDCGNGRLDLEEECDDANSADGDGCDSNCLVTACGNVVVTAGEECDDGNDRDDDDCLSDCRLAVCGDGATHAQAESCDDGNRDDFDACTNACRPAVCGDGVVRAGVEACDEGTDRDNNDDCLTDCSLARCGDGYLRLGQEECDDGNAINGDGCSRTCRREGACSSSALRRTASDALRVLRKAVGARVRCRMRLCDADGDGRITALDVLRTLRSAVAPALVADCRGPTSLLVRLASDETFGALQFRLNYLDAAGEIPGEGAEPSCSILAAEGLAAMNLNTVRGELTVGLVALDGIQGPVDLVRCDYNAIGGPSANDFKLLLDDAVDTEGLELRSVPRLELIAQ